MKRENGPAVGGLWGVCQEGVTKGLWQPTHMRNVTKDLLFI